VVGRLPCGRLGMRQYTPLIIVSSPFMAIILILAIYIFKSVIKYSGINTNHNNFPSIFCSFFHLFFWEEADALLPKIKEEVCLSTPVVFDTRDDPANMIWTQTGCQ
jgi:hypothetical protein